MLDTRQIRLIVTLAAHGNLIRAGRVLDMSPSALTRAVQSVEDKLGVPLFDRSRRGFEPTAVCRAIIAKGAELLERADELAAVVEQLVKAPAGRVVVSAGPAALDTVVAPAVAMLLQRHPNIQTQILDGSAVDARRALTERRAALAVAEVSDLDNLDELTITPLRRHPFFMLARCGHPILSSGAAITAADIFRYPLIAPTYMAARLSSHVSTGLAGTRLECAGVRYPAVIADNLGASLGIVAQSDALVACTARTALLHSRSGMLCVVPWRPAWLETNFALMRLRGVRRTPPMSATVDCLVEADAASYALAGSLVLPGMDALTEAFAVVGRRTEPALMSA